MRASRKRTCQLESRNKTDENRKFAGNNEFPKLAENFVWRFFVKFFSKPALIMHDGCRIQNLSTNPLKSVKAEFQLLYCQLSHILNFSVHWHPKCFLIQSIMISREHSTNDSKTWPSLVWQKVACFILTKMFFLEMFFYALHLASFNVGYSWIVNIDI